MAENDSNTTPQGDATESAGEAQAQQAQSTGTNWEAAYKTLQRNYNTLKQQSDALRAQSAELNENFAAQANRLKELETSLSEKDASLAELQKMKEELEATAGSLKAKLERQNLILSEFPELVEFEAKGLLPTADDMDTLRERLETFKNTLGEIRKGAIEQELSGASPEPVEVAGEGDEKSPQLTLDEAWNKVTQLAGSGDQQAYEEAYSTYLDLLEQAEKE